MMNFVKPGDPLEVIQMKNRIAPIAEKITEAMPKGDDSDLSINLTHIVNDTRRIYLELLSPWPMPSSTRIITSLINCTCRSIASLSLLNPRRYEESSFKRSCLASLILQSSYSWRLSNTSPAHRPIKSKRSFVASLIFPHMVLITNMPMSNREYYLPAKWSTNGKVASISSGKSTLSYLREDP